MIIGVLFFKYPRSELDPWPTPEIEIFENLEDISKFGGYLVLFGYKDLEGFLKYPGSFWNHSIKISAHARIIGIVPQLSARFMVLCGYFPTPYEFIELKNYIEIPDTSPISIRHREMSIFVDSILFLAPPKSGIIIAKPVSHEPSNRQSESNFWSGSGADICFWPSWVGESFTHRSFSTEPKVQSEFLLIDSVKI